MLRWLPEWLLLLQLLLQLPPNLQRRLACLKMSNAKVWGRAEIKFEPQVGWNINASSGLPWGESLSTYGKCYYNLK